MTLRFLYPYFLYGGIPLLFLAFWWRIFRRKSVTYTYGHTHILALKLKRESTDYLSVYLLPTFHMLALMLLVLAAARLQTPDERTEIDVEGVSIMLALDVSQSMHCFDDPQIPKARYVIAQEEAIKFVKRRVRDQIGVILFGAIAATKCPLTIDRTLVVELIRSSTLGMIPDESTALSQAIAMGVRRLQASSAMSKVLVLLTDGIPSPEDAPLLADAVTLAQKASVKIYTIGIGSPAGGYLSHPQGGIIHIPMATWNEQLLREIADRTGGAFFAARSQHELENIYCRIDALERSVQHEPSYAQWYEWYMPLVLCALILLCGELFIVMGRRMIW